MAAWTRSKAELQRSIETKVRAIRGRALTTADERFVIFGAINEAIIDLSLERGLDAPKVITTNTTVSTVADQNYVDLDSAVIQVIDGTVRIIAESIILKAFSGAIADFYRFDPGEDISSSFPSLYAMDTDGSGTMRMLLRGTPDAIYTIDLKVESIPDEDSVGTFPGWYHPALRSKATSIALENLGLDGRADELRYRGRLANIREKMRGRSGPFHIPMRQRASRPVADELRISGGL